MKFQKVFGFLLVLFACFAPLRENFSQTAEISGEIEKIKYKQKETGKELEKAFEEHDGLMHVIKFDPNFDEMRDEMRFQIILKKMRL